MSESYIESLTTWRLEGNLENDNGFCCFCWIFSMKMLLLIHDYIFWMFWLCYYYNNTDMNHNNDKWTYRERKCMTFAYHNFLLPIFGHKIRLSLKVFSTSSIFFIEKIFNLISYKFLHGINIHLFPKFHSA
jgi:hypothetical protein